MIFTIHRHESATGVHFLTIAIHLLKNEHLFSLLPRLFLTCSLAYNCEFAVYSEKCRKSITEPVMDIFYPSSPFYLSTSFPRVISCLDSFDTKGWMKVKQSFSWCLERSSDLIGNEVMLNQRVKYESFSNFSLFFVTLDHYFECIFLILFYF